MLCPLILSHEKVVEADYVVIFNVELEMGKKNNITMVNVGWMASLCAEWFIEQSAAIC